MATTIAHKQPPHAIEFVNALTSLVLVVLVGIFVGVVLGIYDIPESSSINPNILLIALASVVAWKIVFWAMNGRNRRNFNGALTVLLMLGAVRFAADLAGLWQFPLGSPAWKLFALGLAVVIVIKLLWMTMTAMNRGVGEAVGRTEVEDES